MRPLSIHNIDTPVYQRLFAMLRKGHAIFAAAALAASAASASPVDETMARSAAASFLANDAVGRAVLGGRAVRDAVDRNGIWIVSLEPAGHIILSGSDLVEPVVGFSPADFSDPDSGSSAIGMLDGARTASRVAEESGAETRHAKWTKLLDRPSRTPLRASSVDPAAEAVVVQPFLRSCYSQWQPYNDYCPVYDSGTNTREYRGRSPCGCVATAALQVFRHFRWPVRIDGNFQYSHSFTGTNRVETSFPIRFDGHVPIDWNAFNDNYAWYSGGYDLRGDVAESVRYPIARLILWTDVMARMSFGTNGSSASYDNVASSVADWYTPGEWVNVNEGAARIRAAMQACVPCQISLGAYNAAMERTGHEVVADGWAEDSASQYVHINFGFGGTNDGYYNVAANFQEYQEKRAYVGHYPRAKPQLEPLPKVCGPNITLNWHFPDIYNGNLNGFTIAVSRPATATSTFRDDFSASDGASSCDGISVREDSAYGYDGNLLCAESAANGCYTFRGSLMLTSASVLTFKILSTFANWSTYEIQASFDGGGWETICTPTLETAVLGTDNYWYAQDSTWRGERLYLGSHGGQTARFRIVKGNSSGFYFESGRILLDDFQVTDVLEQGTPTTYDVTAFERNSVLTRLVDGASYTFTVTPNISGALVEGEASDPVSCVVAGNHRFPAPGVQSYHQETLSFSASDTSGVWSYSGTAVDGTTIGHGWDCYVRADFHEGQITETSVLSFGWSSDSFFDDGPETLMAVFTDASGVVTTIWEVSNSANSARQNIMVPLGRFAGQSGRITVSYSHTGRNYTSDQCGGRIYAPAITNVRVPTVPAVEWRTETLTALGAPEIRSVSPVAEGFYGECGLGSTAFSVVCSENVTRLTALPSHLALVSDRDVMVASEGGGRFTVTVAPSGITAANARSRMILTLAAMDSNGSVAYRDLSLRFEPSETVPAVTVIETSVSGEGSIRVSVPYSWFVENGLVSSTAAGDAAFHAAATADSDGDGHPNWAEYVCMTDPNNSDSKLKCDIEIVGGRGKVTYEPHDFRSGFRAVIKGTDDLRTPVSGWSTVTTETSSLHFFKVVVEAE